MTPLVSLKVRPAQPFRGMEPFRFIDHQIFFARREETLRLLRRVVVYRGVMLFGDSGTGKSSLVNAGLLPEALREGYHPERIRVQPRRGEEIVIERILVNEEREEYLPSTLAPDEYVPRAVLSVEDLHRELDEPDPSRPPLVIFDQFEELVTLFEEAPAPHERRGRKAAQRAIVDLIEELLDDQKRRIKLLFVFREDYLAKLVELLPDYPQLLQQSVRLTAPTAELVGEIVRGPFDAFRGHFDPELSPALAERLTQAMEERSGGASISLSELQIACLRLWRGPGDPTTVLNDKGVQGLLEDELSEALDRLPTERRYAAVTLLSRMITASGARNVVSEEDLISLAGSEDAIPEADLRAALEALQSEPPLIRRELRHKVPFYEITSEFLAPWIRRQREGLRDYALSPAMARWDRDLQTAIDALPAEDDAQRSHAVDLLVALMFQTRDIDPRIYLRAREVLAAFRKNATLGVLKKVEQAFRAVRVMEDEEDETPLITQRNVLRYTGEPLQSAQARRLVITGAFLVTFSLLSAFAAGWVATLVGLPPDGGPPGYWPVFALATGVMWAGLYVLEALDALGVDDSFYSAPFHPYEYGLGAFECSAGWPLNFILSWAAAVAAATAGHAWLDLDADLTFSIAFAAVTGALMVAYNEAVSLFL